MISNNVISNISVRRVTSATSFRSHSHSRLIEHPGVQRCLHNPQLMSQVDGRALHLLQVSHRFVVPLRVLLFDVRHLYKGIPLLTELENATPILYA